MNLVLRCIAPVLWMVLLLGCYGAHAARLSGGPGYRVWLGSENQVLTQGTNGFWSIGYGWHCEA